MSDGSLSPDRDGDPAPVEDGSGRPRPDRRRRLLRALRLHGLSEAAITGAIRLAPDLLARTRRESLEFAVILDRESGALAGNVIAGESDQIDLSAALARLVRAHQFLQIHTHPGSTSFSDADVAMLVGQTALAAVIVLGADGTVYILSKSRGVVPAAPLAAMVEWNREYAARFPRYRRAVLAGDLSVAEAAKRHSHTVMQGLAPRFGVTYQRLERVY